MKHKEALGTYIGERQWKERLLTANQRMKVTKLPKHAKVYEGVIRLDGRLFADEVDKHFLLRILKEISAEMGYHVIAFSLLDDELHLLLAEKKDAAELPRFMEQLNGKYDTYFTKKGRAYREMVRETPVWEVANERETLLQRCYEIHTLAMKSGYSKEDSAFWWSSMNTYGGHYAWEFVNIWLLLSIFSEDPKEAWEYYQRDFRKRKKMDQELKGF